jgi:hypothetical protein
LERARAHRAEGAFEAVVRAAQDVLAFEPENAEAQSLKQEALDALEVRRGEIEHEHRATAAVAAARGAARTGDLDGAAALLDAFLPPHALVVAARAEIQAQLDARERLFAQASAAKAVARAAIDGGEWDAAQSALQQAASAVPTDPELPGLLDALAKRRAEAEAAARRAATLRQHVSEAERLLADGDLVGSMRSADLALELDPNDRAAQEVRSKAAMVAERRAEEARAAAERLRQAREQAEREAAEREARAAAERERRKEVTAREEQQRRDEEERRRHAEEHERRAYAVVEEAHGRFAAGDSSAALRMLEEFRPGHPIVSEALQDLRAEVKAHEEQQRREKEEAQRCEEAERRARQAVAEARERFASGETKAALTLLERFSPPHPVAARALEDLLAELKAVEDQQRAADHAERRRVEAERLTRIASACNDARAAIAHGQYARALQRLRVLEQAEGKIPDARGLIAEARSGQKAEEARAIEATRRQKREEQARAKELRNRQREMTAALKRARTARTAADAVIILRDALQLDPEHAEYRDLLAVRQTEMISEIERLLEDGQYERARHAIEHAEALGLSTPTLTELRERAQSGGATQLQPPPIPDTRESWWRLADGHRRLLWLPTAAATMMLVAGLAYWGWTRSRVPAAGTDIGPIVSQAQRLMNDGDFVGATHGIVTALKAVPGDTTLQRTLQEILSDAGNRASTAKRAAEASGGAPRPKYAQATAHLESAIRSQRSGPEDAEVAVREFGAAEKLFKEAAGAVPLDVNGIISNAKRLRDQNNYSGAVRELVDGLTRATANTELIQALDETFTIVDNRVTISKRAAETSSSSGRPEYADAEKHLRSAVTLRASGRPDDAESAIREYTAASDLYIEAVTTNARELLGQNNLAGAAHAIVAALVAAPSHEGLEKIRQQILGAAEGRANAAKRSADASGSRGSEYDAATSQLQSAISSKRSNRVEDTDAAVRNYLAAANAFIDGTNKQARAFLARGDLVSASKAIVAALGGLPENPDFRRTLEETLTAAEQRATTAKQKADAVNGSKRVEYLAATSHLQTATSARRSGRLDQAEPAIREYVLAEGMYADAATVDIGSILGAVNRDLSQGKFPDAARAVADGLKRASNNPELKNTLRDIVARAETDANTAKQAAAGASSLPEYADANSRLASAASAGRSDNAEDAVSAVRDYAAAAQLFRDASTRMNTDRIRGDKDRAAILKLLDQYEAAFRALDAPAVGRLDPTAQVKELQSLFSNYKALKLSLTNRQINLQGDTATVSCAKELEITAKRGGGNDSTVVHLTFVVRRAPTNEWKIESSRESR